MKPSATPRQRAERRSDQRVVHPAGLSSALRLHGRRVMLRPLAANDFAAFSEVRIRNGRWLTDWEPLRPAAAVDPAYNAEAFERRCVVRERERGNMELLIATPVSRSELMVGKVLPYAAIGLLQTTLVLVLGTWLFQVPIRGSLLDIYLAAVLLVLANLALGLLISTRARSQFQAMQMTLFLFLPSILLSGFMFPFVGMPRPVQWLAEVLPLTHFLRLVRGIMLRGASLWELWHDALALLAFIVVMMTLAILRFRKRLD